MATDCKLRIAWFSDLSVGRPESLSTYCSRLLLPILARTHQVEVFSDLPVVNDPGAAFNLPYHHYLKAYQRHAAAPFDLFFYQLEDSRACRFIRGHIGLVPGVVWVHDLFCNDLGPEACHTSPWELTIKQFYNSQIGFADRSKAPHQLWPRVFRETSLCPVALFSSSWALSEFKRMISNRLESSDGAHMADTLPIPMDARFLEAQRSATQSDIFRIATVSVPGIEGRMHKVLPVLRRMTRPWVLEWMLNDCERDAALKLVREFGISETDVTFIAPRDVSIWRETVAKSDVALHLHTSPFGHLAPFVQISMAQECPTVVALSAQGEDFPLDVVFGVTPGAHESTQVELIFKALLDQRNRAAGRKGAEYARKVFNSESVAKRLSDLLIESAPRLSYVMDRWQIISKRAKSALISEVMELVADPRGDFIEVNERIISPALKELGWHTY